MRKTLAATAIALSLACNNQGGAGGGGAVKAPETDDQKTLYALGAQIGRSVAPFNLTKEELEYVKAGLHDQATGAEMKAPVEQFFPKIQELYRTRLNAKAEQEKEKSKAFLDKAAAETGAVKSETGMVYKELTAGTGEMPKATDRVKVNYRGTLTDGTEFDSSAKNGAPATFPLMGVIPCWTEGLQKMKVGGKAQLVCPSSIAYGDRGRPPQIPGGATLVFEVELLEILPSAAPPNGQRPMGGQPDAGVRPTK